MKNNIREKKQICTDYKTYDSECYNKNNLNQDMQFISYSKNKFFKYLNQRHDEHSTTGGKKVLMKFEEEQINNNEYTDDIVCSICNDGDYEDNDLIVFCSVIIIKVIIILNLTLFIRNAVFPFTNNATEFL